MYSLIELTAIRTLAGRYVVNLAWILGLAEVESAGRAFWNVHGNKRPAINLEGHYFFARLSKTNQEKALWRGLCHPVAGKTRIPNSYAERYKMLADWMAIDHNAALESISMGVGQVMGAHWNRLGFRSVTEMWDVANKSLVGQVELMLRFIASDTKLQVAISRDDFKGVARMYNGPKYKINAYDKKIAAAVAKWRKLLANTIASTDLRVDGPATLDTTAEKDNIKSLGFDTVEAFQRDKGLVVDGTVGPITRDKLEVAVQHKTEAAKVGALSGVSVATTGVIAIAINEVTDATKHVDSLIAYLKMLGSYGPSVAAVGIVSLVIGVTAYSFWKSAQNATT